MSNRHIVDFEHYMLAAMLPVDYNYFGVFRLKEDLNKFEIIKSDVIQSLESKIKLLGEDNVLPLGIKISDF